MRNRQGVILSIAVCTGIFGAAIIKKATSPAVKPPTKATKQTKRRKPAANARVRPTKRSAASPKAPGVQRYTSDKPEVSVEKHSLVTSPPFDAKHPSWDKQSTKWHGAMHTLGARLQKANVGLVLLVHGTFVGKDPFGVAHLLSRLIPAWKPSYTAKLYELFKKSGNTLFQDKGNWLPAHINALHKASRGTLLARPFVWTSRNDHLARVIGAMRLVTTLDALVQKHKLQQKRLLLIGHSHAGQLFALLTHFLHHSPISRPLWSIALEDKSDAKARKAALMAALQRLRKRRIDLVTMGTPPRYTWRLKDKQGRQSDRIRLLHIVNHRGKGHLAGGGAGALLTKAGDYVQQWGIAGSDLLSAIPSIFKRNKKLNAYLGAGTDPVGWYRRAKKRMRLHHKGHTLLVDYRDNHKLLPNFASTVLGHAVYTELRVFLFQLRLIADRWYR